MTPAPFPNLPMLKFQESVRLWEAGRIAASELEKRGNKALAERLFQVTAQAVRELEQANETATA